MVKNFKIKQAILSLALILYLFPTQAQWHKWHVGGGIGSLTYYGDLSDKFVNAQIQDLGYHFYVERVLTKKAGLYWRLESVNGHFLGSDRAPNGWLNQVSENFNRSLNFRTKIHDINTEFVYYFGNVSKRSKVPFINAYLKAGIGVGLFDVYGDLKREGGQSYYYWSDQTIRDISQDSPDANNAQLVKRDYQYETNLRQLEIEKSYNKFKWQIPIGLGVKMKLGNAASLVIDAQYTYAMTDYLDNVGDLPIRQEISDPFILYAADPAGVIGNQRRNLNNKKGINDSYLYVSAGLSFNIASRIKPKFKPPVFYPKALKEEIDTISTQINDSTKTIIQLDTIPSISVEDSILIVLTDIHAQIQRIENNTQRTDTSNSNKNIKDAETIDSQSKNLKNDTLLIKIDSNAIKDSSSTNKPIIDSNKTTIKADTIIREVSKEVNDTLPTKIDSVVKADTLSSVKPIIDSNKIVVKADTIIREVSKEDNDTTPSISYQKQIDSLQNLLKVQKEAIANNSVYWDSLAKVQEQKISDLNNKIKSLEKSSDSLANKTLPEVIEKKDTISEIKNLKQDSLSAKLEELKKQIESQKRIEDSLKNQIFQNANLSTSRLAPVQTDEQYIALQKRINDIENQLSIALKNTPEKPISAIEKNLQQARIDSLNRELLYQKLLKDATIANSQAKKVGFTPKIEPVISIPINGGKKEKRAEKKADKKKIKVGYEYDGKPGFIASKKASRENETKATPSIEIDSTLSKNLVSDSNEVEKKSDIETDSLLVTFNQTLLKENESLKNQVTEIKTNQDSLLVLVQQLVLQLQKPVERPAPVVVEKEIIKEVNIPAKEDNSQLIESLLSQPSTKIFFGVGKSTFSNQYKNSIDKLANQLKKYSELKLELRGYADPTGNADANLKLSEKRAQSIQAYLLDVHRIAKDRISVLPAGQEDGSKDLNYSRRVEIQLVK
ncbi:MAG: OmpA family protein [Chitinophagales bacterium]|nr:OmpA family protein [Chitinophagales bacterium]